jgi:hypothetical protein
VLEGTWSHRGARPALPPPRRARALTVGARAGVSAPDGWPAPRVVHGAGNHECVGGFALAAAVDLLAVGEADEILVLGEAPDRGYAFLLVNTPLGTHPS